MATQAIQCPNCGAPLHGPVDAEFVYCVHCGSRLRITQGSSGHLLAKLTDIGADTSVIATGTALLSLATEQQELEEQYEAARESLEEAIRQSREGLAGGVGIVSLALLLFSCLLCSISNGAGAGQKVAVVLLILGGILFVWNRVLSESDPEEYAREEAESTHKAIQRRRSVDTASYPPHVKRMVALHRKIAELKRRRRELSARMDDLTEQM
jgi:hypothetical protein